MEWKNEIARSVERREFSWQQIERRNGGRTKEVPEALSSSYRQVSVLAIAGMGTGYVSMYSFKFNYKIIQL